MKVSDLVKWKKSLNEVRYLFEEISIAKEMSSVGNAEFQKYVRQYCQREGIELDRVLGRHEAPPPQPVEKEETIEENYDISTEFDMFSEIDEQEQKPEQEKDYKQELKEIFTKLFKKLAVYLHPDKVLNLTEQEREKRITMFRNAKSALDKGDYFILLEMSDKFDIRIPNNYKQQTRWMKDRIESMRNELQNERSTYNYMFAEAEEEEKKEMLVKSFLRQAYGIDTTTAQK